MCPSGYYLVVKGQTDSQLLAAYTEQRSDAAFGELVRRSVDLVYSAALRICGDHHLEIRCLEKGKGRP